uniref:Uncharacterized protein n=1 Tax=Setaria italica TaxID=4555 RepID=K3ZPC4_SETIT
MCRCLTRKLCNIFTSVRTKYNSKHYITLP